jgi:very-short-patch-repair endonuclease
MMELTPEEQERKQVIRIWEHEIRKDPENAVKKIIALL